MSAQRWRSLRVPVDWAAALVLCAAGLADVIHTDFAQPLWAGIVATLLVFLPLGLRRRHPLEVLVVVGASSLVLELGLGDPSNSKQFGFETFVAWLIVSYSCGAYLDGKRHRIAVAVGVLVAALWVSLSYALGGSDQNTVPSVFFSTVAWLGGRGIQRRQQQVELLSEHADRLERERAERVRALVAEERTQIARELHDVIAHGVSVMVVQAQAGPRLAADPDAASSAFRSIEASGKEALVDLRRLLGILRTEDQELAIGPQPGLASLPNLVQQVCEAGLPVELVIEGDQRPLPPGVDLSAYRIVQEALTNTLKHAHAGGARVSVRYNASAVELDVDDDGRGSSQHANGSGHGLIGMRERVALYGGHLEVGPREGGGYKVSARLPLGGAP
ncbi:MAG TPA: sensor histidine kinase [Thermoleophilaceae bacterium]|nr:sensor histidine kinase [Thermoleophilaceae bacterium]